MKKKAGILEYELANLYRQDQYQQYQNNAGTVIFQQFMQQDLNKRISQMEVKRFDQIYPNIPKGSFVSGQIPNNLINEFTLANESSFLPAK